MWLMLQLHQLTVSVLTERKSEGETSRGRNLSQPGEAHWEPAQEHLVPLGRHLVGRAKKYIVHPGVVGSEIQGLVATL